MTLPFRAAVTVAWLLLAGVHASAQAPLPTITLTPGESYFRVDGTFDGRAITGSDTVTIRGCPP